MLSTPRYGPGLSPMCNIFGREGGWGAAPAISPTLASTAYPAVNKALYFPVVLPLMGTAYKLWWLNGATASTNNIQVGVYADNGAYKPGAALIRGTSTLAAGANICQFDDITNTLIGPGLVWFAIWGSGTTTTLFRTNSLRQNRFYSEASLTGGLPTTATPAFEGAFAYFPVFGVQFRASP